MLLERPSLAGVTGKLTKIQGWRLVGSRIDSAAVWAWNASYPVALELIYIFQTQISQHNRGEKLYSLQQVIYYGPNLIQDPEIVRFVVGWTQFETMIEVNTVILFWCFYVTYKGYWSLGSDCGGFYELCWTMDFEVKFPVTTTTIGRSSSTQHPQKIKSMENRITSPTSFQEFILTQILLKLGALAQKVLIYQQFLVFL